MNLKNKRVAVTGGSGFLGKRIVRELEKKGAAVIVPRKKDYDFRNFESTNKFYESENPDILIHSAALYGGLGINQSMPADIYFYNRRMSDNIFQAAINQEEGKPRIEKLVAIGSACGYPSGLGTNMREELIWDGPIDKSVRNYGSIKREFENAAHVCRDQYGMNSVVLHLATLYGEGDTFNPERSHVPAALIRKFTEAKMQNKPFVNLWGVPGTIREFMYVGDAAEGIVRAAEMFGGVEGIEDHSKHTLNIGTGDGMTIDTLAKTIAKILDYRGKFKYDGKSAGQKEKALNTERMKKVLGWQPRTSLEDGLRKTIEWYIANKEEADKRF